MYSYVTAELPDLVLGQLPLDKERMSLMGALKNAEWYRSVSVFLAICHPSQCDWGIKAFTGYLSKANVTSAWHAHDTTELIQWYAGPRLLILLDQDGADDSLKSKQLLPDHLILMLQGYSDRNKLDLASCVHPGYDQSYFYIQTLVAEHIDFHAKYLLAWA
ncbi:hypothetical protein H4R34_003388, partial [Dimargaris verticillata]